MANLAVEIHDQHMTIQSHTFRCTFADVGNNRTPIVVFLRSLCSPETGKGLFTHQQIAEAFGYPDRQHIENAVAGLRLLQRVQRVMSNEEAGCDARRYVQDL